MSIKDTLENHPAVLLFGVLATGFAGGVGAVSYLEAREEKFRDRIVEELRAKNNDLSQQNEDLNADYQKTLAMANSANAELEQIKVSLKNVPEEQDCLDFSGAWKSLDLPPAQAEIMNLTQSGCQIDGTISGGPRHVVKGEVKSGILHMDIERTTVQNGSDCLNILRSVSRKHPGDENKLVRTITEILGNCGDIGSATQLPVVNYQR